MSGVWRKTLVYLGLVEDPEAHDELPEQFPRSEPGAPQGGPPGTGTRTRRPVRPVEADPGARSAGGGAPSGSGGEDTVRPLRFPAERERSRDSRVHVSVVNVRAFDDCEEIGATFRDGGPVLFDLGRVEGDVGRRVLDFVSGVTFALGGSLTKVGSPAFLLVPEGVRVPDDERQRLVDLGYRAGS